MVERLTGQVTRRIQRRRGGRVRCPTRRGAMALPDRRRARQRRDRAATSPVESLSVTIGSLPSIVTSDRWNGGPGRPFVSPGAWRAVSHRATTHRPVALVGQWIEAALIRAIRRRPRRGPAPSLLESLRGPPERRRSVAVRRPRRCTPRRVPTEAAFSISVRSPSRRMHRGASSHSDAVGTCPRGRSQLRPIG